MEFLSNFWYILNNENEMLTQIISTPLSFIEIYLIFKLFTSALKITYTKILLYIYVISVFVVSTICRFGIPEPYNILINYAFIFLRIVV